MKTGIFPIRRPHRNMSSDGVCLQSEVTVFRKTVTCFLFAASKSQHQHISTANIRQKIEKCWLFHGSCEKKPTSSGTLGESDTPALAALPANQPKLAYRQTNPSWHAGHIEHATPARYSQAVPQATAPARSYPLRALKSAGRWRRPGRRRLSVCR